jgi:hypothetical protein
MPVYCYDFSGPADPPAPKRRKLSAAERGRRRKAARRARGSRKRNR